MKRFYLLFLVCAWAVGIGYSQKEYRTIRSALKSGKSLDQTLKQIQKYAGEQKLQEDPELYQYGLLVNQKLNEVENEKAYLKQKYDTAKFFSSIYGMFDYALQCDKKEQEPNNRGKIKFKYRTKNVTMLKAYYQNLRNGGQYYLLRKNYDEAYKYFALCLDVSNSEMMQNVSFFQNRYVKARIGYWANVCSYMSQKSDAFFKYNEYALQDTANHCQVLEMKSDMLAARGDTTQMLKTLHLGFDCYPTHDYFFSHLVDYYNNHAQYSRSLSLCDSLLQINGSSLLVKYAKSVVLLNLKQYEPCIRISDEIIKKDSSYVDAYYNIGVAYCSMAGLKERTIDPSMRYENLKSLRSEINGLYKKARPYMEFYRKMQPDEIGKWGNLLYRIYLHLNREKDFKEIDKLLSQKGK